MDDSIRQMANDHDALPRRIRSEAKARIRSSLRIAAPGVRASRRRGARAGEHSRRVRNGLALGADGLELDVRLSRDGVIVMHTRSCDRQRSGAGRSLDTADELAAPTPALVRPDGLPAARPQACPRLAEVLDRFRDARVIVELKINMMRTWRGARLRRFDGRARRSRVPRLVWRRVLRAVRRSRPPRHGRRDEREEGWRWTVSWCAGRCRAGVPRLSRSPSFRANARRVAAVRARTRTVPAVLVQVWTVNADAGRAPAAVVGCRRADNRSARPGAARVVRDGTKGSGMTP